MGEIEIDGVLIETDDMALLVRFKSLTELDRDLAAWRELLAETGAGSGYEFIKSQVFLYERAVDYAEWCFENNIPTVDLNKDVKKRDREQGLYALEKYKELEKEVRGLKESQKNFETYMMSKAGKHTEDPPF